MFLDILESPKKVFSGTMSDRRAAKRGVSRTAITHG
jgi:hypothetical protein